MLGAPPADAGLTGEDDSDTETDSSRTLNFNEQTHLVFLCEEEKLARDVYITPGTQYPGAKVFGNIDVSEERHKCSVADMLTNVASPIPALTTSWAYSPATDWLCFAGLGKRSGKARAVNETWFTDSPTSSP
jgi:hypothetical protein